VGGMRIEMTGKNKPIYFQSFSPTQKVIQELGNGHYQPWVDLFASEFKNAKVSNGGDSGKISDVNLLKLNNGLIAHLDALIEGFLASTLTQNFLKERITSLSSHLEKTQLIYNKVEYHWIEEINLRIMRALTLVSTAKEPNAKSLLKL
jgi:hypothetical protein